MVHEEPAGGPVNRPSENRAWEEPPRVAKSENGDSARVPAETRNFRIAVFQAAWTMPSGGSGR